LLHHAVELYLKGALAGILNATQMKKWYGHDLKRLWKVFKGRHADPALDRFDGTIKALHRFEDIRYPDHVAKRGGILPISWAERALPVRLQGLRRPRTYDVAIADVDRLVIQIMRRIPVNPKFFVGRLHRSGRGALAYQNPHAARWRRRKQ
jgi:hypothetical protein